MSITVNGNSLEEHLDHEKTKEIIYDVHIQISKHSLYKKPSAKPLSSRGRSGKVKEFKSKEDIFLSIFDLMPNDIQDLMANTTKSKQDEIWNTWNKADKLGKSLPVLLRSIIEDIA